MSEMGLEGLRDVRLEGFTKRTTVNDAIEWVDHHSSTCDSEEVLVGAAARRVLAKPFLSPADWPPADTAVADGYALRSAETIGADSYTPLLFFNQVEQKALGPSSAALISSGAPLPLGADTVAPFELVRAGTGNAELIGTVARGAGVSFKGQEALAGTPLIHNSHPLRPSDLGLISSFGVERVRVVRRPLVRLILTGCKQSPEHELNDANGPMLCSLISRDGGVLESFIYGLSEQSAIADLMAKPGADVVLISGRTGTGWDDVAPRALADAGTLSIHGIAFSPGASTGMGSAGKVPVILLPGSPLHCLCAYDLLAGRLIRRLGGRCSQLPYRVRHATVGRKIVSSVGDVEFCRVRLLSGEASPLGSADSVGLVSAAQADGFILVPAPMEGYASGASVAVYMYDEAGFMEGTCI